MFPVSTPSWGIAIRCVVLSLFFHTTVWPVVHIAGLGENDWSPLLPAMVMVVTLDPVGDGVVGGVVELLPPYPPDPPQLPQSSAARHMQRTGARMISSTRSGSHGCRSPFWINDSR